MKTTRPTTSSVEGADPRGTPVAGSVERTARTFWGRALCVLGLVVALVGAFGIDVSLEVVGLLLGVAGYALGARRLGPATVVLSIIAMFFVLAVYQGYLPAPWPVTP